MKTGANKTSGIYNILTGDNFKYSLQHQSLVPPPAPVLAVAPLLVVVDFVPPLPVIYASSR